MRVIIIGAGAVGVTLGLSLEHTKQEVAYLVRKGRRDELRQLIVINAKTEKPRKRERPTVFEIGEEPPPFEWAILAVRGDQIPEAIALLDGHVRRDARVGVVSSSTEDLAAVRAAHSSGPVFSIVPTFSAWSEEKNVWRWFQPPLLKTIVSGEGEAAAEEAAKELAIALEASGLPTLHVVSAHDRLVGLMAPGIALLAAWELCEWDIDRLGSDGKLRDLAAGAMSEAARAVRDEARGAARLLSYAPAPALSLILRALPRLADKNVRAMWKHHGPKIREQTRAMIDALIARRGDGELPRLRELRARLPAIGQ